MLRRFTGLLLAASLMLASMNALAQEERSYTEGVGHGNIGHQDQARWF